MITKVMLLPSMKTVTDKLSVASRTCWFAAVRNDSWTIKMHHNNNNLYWKKKGENVYPREVEDILHTHPAVIEAHVKRHRQYAHTISKARDLNNN